MSLDNKYVLVLNNSWVPIGVKKLKDAIISIYDNKDWFILQIDRIDGELNVIPWHWNEWVNLIVPDNCDHIKTTKGIIRMPTVIIAKSYNKLFLKKLRPTKNSIYNRDNGICQYTGKKLSKNNCSIDHMIPKSRGGKNTWENMVLCDKRINNKKGSKLPEECNLKVLKKPKAPPPLPAAELISIRHPDWEYFIN